MQTYCKSLKLDVRYKMQFEIKRFKNIT
ncbi:hypothetical protein AGR4C_Cc100068 [Agrobacterium tumefaciens str. Kerr 14]|uniref:Uncharacterized protein n=1 Tax=Agrobacterium tumefaciens str. Kerr 14 TaxID=1183424 RepID=A0A1S7NLF4_AGRTU|nr:hypothetical protein AGR4C_Cc100068 [Agrobacterium tumefaciens str. Kerr 14]